MFGRVIEGEQIGYWGARAIYQGYSHDYYVDILWDRQSREDMSDGLVYWINNRALPWLQQRVKEICLSTDDPQVIVLDEFKYRLEASTNKSYGYLYIGAIERAVTPDGTRTNDATGKEERVFICGDKRVVWGVDWDVPEPGTKGKVNVNGIGAGTVVGYCLTPYHDLFLLNLQVELKKPPAWWKKQTMTRDIEMALKDHVISHDFRHPENPNKDSLKRFKQSYKLPPCIVWDGDFKIDAKAGSLPATPIG